VGRLNWKCLVFHGFSKLGTTQVYSLIHFLFEISGKGFCYKDGRMYGCLWLYNYEGMPCVSFLCSCMWICDIISRIDGYIIIHDLSQFSGRAWYNRRGDDPWHANYSKWLYCWAGIFLSMYCFNPPFQDWYACHSNMIYSLHRKLAMFHTSLKMDVGNSRNPQNRLQR
jgi:hypothetical protein